MAQLAARLRAVGDDPQTRDETMGGYLRNRAWRAGVPLSGSFELTPLCNLTCKMCYARLSKDQMDRPLLAGEQWTAIMDQAVEAGMMYASLTGGECLTHPDFKAIYLHLRRKGVITSVLTNGTLIDEGWADFLGSYPPHSVQVSVYGSDEDNYQWVTGHRAFQRMADGIQKLKDRGIKVSLAAVVSRYLQEDIFAILDLAKQMELPINYATDVDLPRAETGRRDRDHNARVDAVVALRRRLAARKGAQIAPTADDAPYHKRQSGEQDGGMPCGCGRSAFHIDWRGDMTGCPGAIEPKFPAIAFTKAWAQLGDWAFHHRAARRCAGCQHEELCGAIHCPLTVERSFSTQGQSPLCQMARLLNSGEV